MNKQNCVLDPLSLFMWHPTVVPFTKTISKLSRSSSFIGDHQVGRYGGRGLNVLLQRWPTAAASEGLSCVRPWCWGGGGGRGGGRTTAGEDFRQTWTQKAHIRNCLCTLTVVLLCVTIFSLFSSLPASLSVLKANGHHELHVGCRWHRLHGVSAKQQSLRSKQGRPPTVQALQKIDVSNPDT